MGMRTLYQPKCFQPELVQICGKATGAAGTTFTSKVAPGIASVVDGTSGVITVTLEDKWDTLMFASAQVIDANSPDDWEVVLTAEDVAGAKTLTFTAFKGGAATSLSTDEKLMLNILVRNTARAR